MKDTSIIEAILEMFPESKVSLIEIDRGISEIDVEKEKDSIKNADMDQLVDATSCVMMGYNGKNLKGLEKSAECFTYVFMMIKDCINGLIEAGIDEETAFAVTDKSLKRLFEAANEAGDYEYSLNIKPKDFKCGCDRCN